MEVVGARRTPNRRTLLRGRARGSGARGTGRGADEGWGSSSARARGSVLGSARTRQLGRRRRALCLDPLPRGGAIREEVNRFTPPRAEAAAQTTPQAAPRAPSVSRYPIPLPR